MMGPLSFQTLSLCLVLLHTHTLHAKSLSAGRAGGRGLDGSESVRRHRRDLRDTLPYEAQMMSYPAAGDPRGQGSELYYQPDEWKRQALQRLVENDQRRDQEAAYVAGLLRLLSEAEGREEEEEEPGEEPGDFQGPYPLDYDETERGMSMGKPQASWQGLVDPQLAQALMERYRQERMLQQELQLPESPSRGSDSHDRDQETLRYLVAKILSSIAPSNPRSGPGRRARRDLAAVGGGVRAATPPAVQQHRRSRRSLEDVAPPPAGQDAPLLRVKRLGDGEEGGGEEGGHRPLQRMKRVDTELAPGRAQRRRRASDHDLLVQQILQYLPK